MRGRKTMKSCRNTYCYYLAVGIRIWISEVNIGVDEVLKLHREISRDHLRIPNFQSKMKFLLCKSLSLNFFRTTFAK